MLLVADWVIPVSHPPIPGGGVLVAKGAIQAVAPAAELRARYPGEEVWEFPGCALLPGFINAHSHLDYSAFGGLIRKGGFSWWMLRLLRARRKLDEEDLSASALWGAYECLRNGVTAIADTSYEGVTVARAARAAGLRARVYLEVFGLDDAGLPDTMGGLQARLERAKAEGGQRADGAQMPPVEWGVSPHAPYTVSQRLYGEAARFARRTGLPMATHVAESRAESRLLQKGSGALALAYKAAHLWNGRGWQPPRVSPVQYVSDANALGPDVLVVHAVQVAADDIAVLASSRASVAHCPRSNLRLKCGVAPAADMRAAGIAVGLGTDSLASNDDLDMRAEMIAALEASRARASRAGASGPPALAPSDVLRMATLEGATALSWETLVGSLEPGKRADLSAIRLREDRSTSGDDALAEEDLLVEGAMGGEVQMTMVEGKVVYRGAPIPEDVVGGLEKTRQKLSMGG